MGKWTYVHYRETIIKCRYYSELFSRIKTSSPADSSQTELFWQKPEALVEKRFEH